MNLVIHVNQETLSDGSHVYNVRLGNVTLSGYDQKCAEALAEAMAAAINAYAVDRATVAHHY